ncbi:hypothetical protein D3C85_959750 [compost metagenome]
MAVGTKLRVAQAATAAEQVIRGDGCGQRNIRHRQVILARRQRFQVAGDGHQVAVAEVLGTVMNDVGHVARHRGKAILPGLEQLHRVVDGPQVTQAERAPLFHGFPGQIVLAAGTGIAHGLLLEGNAPWRMASATVPQALHQIGAAVHSLILGWVGYEGRVIDKQPIPEPQPPTLVERPAHVRL